MVIDVCRWSHRAAVLSFRLQQNCAATQGRRGGGEDLLKPQAQTHPLDFYYHDPAYIAI